MGSSQWGGGYGHGRWSQAGKHWYFVTKGLCTLGDTRLVDWGLCYCPDIDIIFNRIPTEGAILSRCLAEELVILYTGIRWMVLEKHDHHSLVFNQF